MLATESCLRLLIRQAIDGNPDPTEQEVSCLVPHQPLALAKEWKRSPEKVIAALSRPQKARNPEKKPPTEAP
jgi:hypothetical protein